MAFVFIFLTLTLIIIAGITLTNTLFFPRLKTSIKTQNTPFVSILIPARNEAPIISKTLSHLIQQDYKNYEIIVLDDHSDDGTGDIAGKISAQIRVIHGQPLPEGWLGKNWACHQLAQASRGDILIFTDADVQWSDKGMPSVIGEMLSTNADLCTIWPTQHTHTIAERLVVPMMALVVMAYLPIIGVHFTPLAIFSAANGQCMAWKRKAYFALGGHERVRDNVLEDVTLARIAKQHHLKLRMADGNHLISCRMYADWASVRDGYAKNIVAGYGNSITFLVLAGIFHWLVFIFPIIVFAGSFFITDWQAWRMWSAMLIIMGLTIRALTAQFTHQRLLDSLFMPFSVILMTRIAYRAIVWHFQGGPNWKGRKVTRGRKAINT